MADDSRDAMDRPLVAFDVDSLPVPLAELGLTREDFEGLRIPEGMRVDPGVLEELRRLVKLGITMPSNSEEFLQALEQAQEARRERAYLRISSMQATADDWLALSDAPSDDGDVLAHAEVEVARFTGEPGSPMALVWESIQGLVRAGLPQDPSELLNFVTQLGSVRHQLDCLEVEAGLAWVLQNPPCPHEEQYGPPDEVATAGGDGAPRYQSGAADMFRAAQGKDSRGGASFLSNAGELVTRLPLTWAKVKAQEIPIAKAQMLARATQHLTVCAVRALDEEIAPHFKDMRRGQWDRIIAEAEAVFMPAFVHQQVFEDTQNRGIFFNNRVTKAGTVGVRGAMDAADALSLQQLLAAGAKVLQEAGIESDLPTARARAAGMIARGELKIQHPGESPSDASTTSTTSPTSTANMTSAVVPHDLSVPPVQLRLHVHFARDQLVPSSAHDVVDPESNPHRLAPGIRDGGGEVIASGGFGYVEELDGPILLAQIANWCGRAQTQVRILPVLDLADSYSSPGYTPGRALRDQVIVRDEVCVFPGCNRRARSADLDHIQPWGDGGQTTSENLAPLCRRHHRAKTRRQWEYTTFGDSYEWTCLRAQLATKFLRVRKRRPNWFRFPAAEKYPSVYKKPGQLVPTRAQRLFLKENLPPPPF